MIGVCIGPAGSRWPHALRIGIALVLPVVIGSGVVLLLREPFGPLRLAAKCAVPAAILLPVAMLKGAVAGRIAAPLGLAVVAMAAVTWACFAVFGVPLDPQVLVSLLSLAQPSILPIGLAFGAGALVLVLRYRKGGLPPKRAAPGLVLFSAAEAIYFGGFLMASTLPLGVWAGILVGSGVLASAAVRGVPAGRALLGSAAFTTMMAWSGDPYAAFVIHLVLLDTARSSGRASIGRAIRPTPPSFSPRPSA